MLHMRRLMPAPRATVYEALTDPMRIAKWWGPNGFSIPTIEFDPIVGASYRIAMQPPEGELFHLQGEFTEVEPPARLGYTFVWDPPDPEDRPTTVTLSLEERDGESEISFTQGEFATEERRALHVGGWTDSFNKLEALLGRGPSS